MTLGLSAKNCLLSWKRTEGTELPRWLSVKESTCSAGDQVQFLGREDPPRRKWQPLPVFLPGESRRQRSPAGYSPWGHTQLGTTKWLTLSLSYAKYLNRFPPHKLTLGRIISLSRCHCNWEVSSVSVEI